MLTKIGQFLVFVNLILGMAFLSFAVGLYTQKIDWVNRKTAEGVEIEGELTRLKADIDAATWRVRQASAAWGEGATALTAAEADREKRRAAFAQRLTWARTNDPAGVGFYAEVMLPSPTDPARPSALIDVDQKGPPLVGPDAKPLRGAETLLETVTKNDKETAGYAAASAALRKEQAALGLEEVEWQARVSRQGDLYDNLLNEGRYLETFEVNWFERLVTVQRRQRQLQARLAEFQ